MSPQINKTITNAWPTNEETNTKSMEATTWRAWIVEYHSYFKTLKLVCQIPASFSTYISAPNKEQNQQF